MWQQVTVKLFLN